MFRFLSLFIAAVLLFSTLSPAVFAEGDINVAVNFIDISNNYWANDAVSNLAKSGIIKGYEDNTFKPENHVTQEEFAALVTKGENTITFKATNSNGKSTSISKKITFTPPAPVLSFGYMPVNTTSSNISVSWNVSDKNDPYPKVFLNDILQSYYQTSSSMSLNIGANQILLPIIRCREELSDR